MRMFFVSVALALCALSAAHSAAAFAESESQNSSVALTPPVPDQTETVTPTAPDRTEVITPAVPSTHDEITMRLRREIIYALPRVLQEELNIIASRSDGELRLPSPESLAKKRRDMESDASADPERKRVQLDFLQNAARYISLYLSITDEERSVEERLKNTQSQLAELERELDKANRLYGITPPVKKLQSMDLNDVNLLLNATVNELESVQSNLNDNIATQTSLQTLPTRAQNIKSANNERIFTINRRLSDPDSGLNEKERTALAVEAYILQYQSSLYQLELQSVTFFQDYFNYKIRINQLHKEYLSRYTAEIRARQNALLTSGRSDDQSDDGPDFSTIPQLKSEVALNLALTDKINSAVIDNSQLARDLQLVESALNTSYQIGKSIQTQISDISESLLLSRLLNRQQSELPVIRTSFQLDEMITNLTISLYDLKNKREELFDVHQYVELRIAQEPSLSPFREQLRQIIRQRYSLYDQLYRARSESLTQAVDLRDRYAEYSEISDGIRTLIGDNLFWLASNSGLSGEFFLNFKTNAMQQLSDFVNYFRHPEQILPKFYAYLWLLIPLIFTGLLSYYLQPFFIRRINRCAMRLDRRNDGYLVTPLSLLYHFGTILPLLTVLSSVGSFFIFLILQDSSHQLEITFLLALHLTCFLYIRDILSDNSLAQRHFGFPPYRNAQSRMIIDHIWFVSIPMLLIANIRILEPTLISSDIIGYTFMLCGFIYLTLFAVRVSKQYFESYTPTMAFWVFSVFGVFTPLTLSIMLGMGYYYTVIQLLNRVATTLYIFFLYFITANTLRRELYVAENKMLQSARDRTLNGEEQPASSDRKGRRAEGNIRRGAQVYAMRLDLVNTRSFKLFNIFLLSVFLYFMYLQWSDLAGVLTYLDNIYLWTDVSIVDGKEVTTNYLSLGHLLLAVVTVAVTTVLTRNLPPLLERLFLLRSSNNKSISYTIRIISTYLIATLGTLLAAGYMGISWDSLQWLVAALSVGLGFGLQEIFGNFVSGIIILFERQLRVGDIVTLNSLSGKVSKIRIRATTIESFDNKEVVIPNKQFITSALTNWSLSNTITKIEFLVGVAYDADVVRAKDLLRGIIRRCRNLNRDKKPQVFVQSLDASAVTIKCEVYVNEIGKRKETYDYLSVETLRVFKENGIEIPFDQMDVTIRNLDTLQTFFEHRNNMIASLQAEDAAKS